MNAQSPNTQFTFQLPSMSYVDAKWEEPNLRVGQPVRRASRQRGVAGWLAARLVAFRESRLERRTMNELDGMTDRELLDIGLTRADVGRVFNDHHNADLRARGGAN